MVMLVPKRQRSYWSALRGILEARKPEQAVLHKRSARRESILMLEEGRAACRIAQVVEESRRSKVAPAEIRMEVAVKVVRSGFGHDVQNDVSGLAVFRVVVVRQNLKFLYLFHRCAESVARDEDLRLIPDISAVHIHLDAAVIKLPGPTRSEESLE